MQRWLSNPMLPKTFAHRHLPIPALSETAMDIPWNTLWETSYRGKNMGFGVEEDLGWTSLSQRFLLCKMREGHIDER